MYHFGTGHAECNVHIIRYLRKNTEASWNTWSDDMITLLCEMNRKRKEYMEQRMSALPDEIIREYEEKYFLLLQKGKEENKTTAHINMQSRTKNHFLTGWKSIVRIIFYFCIIFLYHLMIIYQKEI